MRNSNARTPSAAQLAGYLAVMGRALNSVKMLIHELKTWPNFFNQVKSGLKNFEVRKDDRPFSIGDELLLREFVPKDYYEDQTQDEYYTGNICRVAMLQ